MRKRDTTAALLVAAVAAVAVGVWVWQQARARRDSATVVESVRRVMKLSTVEMTVSDWRLRRDSKNLFGFLPIACEKTLAVFFRGTVSAGFDLGNDGGALDIATDARARRVAVRLPAPRLLLVDVPPPELLVTDGSLCNAVNAQDYALVHAEARKAVQAEALSRGILKQAESQLRAVVTEVLRPLGYDVDVQVQAPDLLSASPGD